MRSVAALGSVHAAERAAFLSLTSQVEEAGLPFGAGVLWFTNTAPTNYFFLDGAAISRTANPRLFALYGTTFGAGDGSTTFNLPNLKGRIPVGRDSTQVEFDVLGETGGAKTHTLVTGEVPIHAHDLGSHVHTASSAGEGQEHTHTFSGTTSGFSTNHYHDFGGASVLTGGSTWFFNQSAGTFGVGAIGNTNWGAQDHSHTYSGTTSGRSAVHTHGITVNAATGNTGNAGSGSAHNNLQPYIVVNYIVRAG